MPKLIIRSVAALALLCSAVLAQTPVTPPASAPAFNPNTFLAPYLDSQTLAVVHVDASKIDTAALDKYITGFMDEAKVPADDEMRKSISMARSVSDAFLVRFKQLGGRHVFALFSHPDIWPHLQPVALLIKIEPGGNPKMMQEFLATTFGIAPPPATNAAREPLSEALQITLLGDDVLFLGQTTPLKRLQTLKPQPRPELTLNANAPLEAVAALSADTRRALAELMPTFPQEIGGGSTAFLTQDGLVVRLTVTLPPKPSLALAFESPALKLRLVTNVTGVSTWTSSTGMPTNAIPNYTPEVDAFIVKLRDLFLSSNEYTTSLKDPTFPFSQNPAELTAAIKEILTPDSGTLTLQDRHIRQLVPQLLKYQLTTGQKVANRTRTALNVRDIVRAIIVYASDNKDAYPESLDVLVKAKALRPEQLVNTNDPKHRTFIYQPDLMNKNDPQLPILWEQVDEGAEGRVVGFADGHVEWMRAQEFTAALKYAESIKTKSSPPKAMP